MEQMFNVSSNPHVRARMTTAKIMQLVVIALLPAALMGIYNHGLKALAVLVVSTGSAALAEWLYDHFMHKKNTVKDFSAVVTGLLIGLFFLFRLLACNRTCCNIVYKTKKQPGNQCDHGQRKSIFYDLIFHFFAPPFPKATGRVKRSI